MANIYQLENPTIDIIICYCQDMEANEQTEVYDFGKNGDLVLHIIWKKQSPILATFTNLL